MREIRYTMKRIKGADHVDGKKNHKFHNGYFQKVQINCKKMFTKVPIRTEVIAKNMSYKNICCYAINLTLKPFFLSTAFFCIVRTLI